MAPTPGWRAGLSDAARWVAARGLPTRLVPPATCLDPTTWRRLVDECARHRLDGLLVAAVASHELPVAPDQSAEAAAIEVALTRVRMVYEPRMVDLLAAMGSAGIDTRLLKGSALAHLDYPDPQMRPTGDIDVLVRGEQIDEAIDLLRRLGATRRDPDPVPGYAATVGKGATLVLGDGVELDLHRLLIWGPIGVRLPAAELWETARSLSVDGCELRTLGLEETLLHVACHLMVGSQPRGISLRDVAQLLAAPEVDEERVLGLARRWGTEAVLAGSVCLVHAELALGDDLLLASWAAGYAPRLRDRAWMRIGRPGASLPAVEPVATALELDRRAQGLLLRATLWPAAGSWPTPQERMGRVMRRLGRSLSGTR